MPTIADMLPAAGRHLVTVNTSNDQVLSASDWAGFSENKKNEIAIAYWSGAYNNLSFDQAILTDIVQRVATGRIPSELIAQALVSRAGTSVLSGVADVTAFETLIQKLISLYKSLRIAMNKAMLAEEINTFNAAVDAAKNTLKSAIMSGAVSLAFSATGVVAGTAFMGAGLLSRLQALHRQLNKTKPPAAQSTAGSKSAQAADTNNPSNAAASAHPDTPHANNLITRYDSKINKKARTLAGSEKKDPSVVAQKRQEIEAQLRQAEREVRQRGGTDAEAQVAVDSKAKELGLIRDAERAPLSSILNGVLTYGLPGCGQGASQLAGAQPTFEASIAQALSEQFRSQAQRTSSDIGANEESLRSVRQLLQNN